MAVPFQTPHKSQPMQSCKEPRKADIVITIIHIVFILLTTGTQRDSVICHLPKATLQSDRQILNPGCLVPGTTRALSSPEPAHL